MDFNNRFPDECANGAHIFKIIDDKSKCCNCGLLYQDFVVQKVEEFKEKK
jgi:hypothetical protein